MPFKSEKQRRYLWANEPEIAREWTDRYGASQGGITRLPFQEGTPLNLYFDEQSGYNWPRHPSGITHEDFIQEAELIRNPALDKIRAGAKQKELPTYQSGWDKFTGGIADLATRGQNYIMPAWNALQGNMGAAALGLFNPIGGALAFMGGMGQPMDPELQAQVDDLKSQGWIGDQSSPYKITGGGLAGQNLVSMFGTNDYGDMLQKRIDRRNKVKIDKWSQDKKDRWDLVNKALAEEKRKADEAKAARTRPYAPDVGSGEGQSGITSTTTASQASRMGGGSRQAKSGSQKSGGSGRTDSGWGW